MQKQFLEEIPFPVEGSTGRHDWYQIGLDVDGDRVRPFVSYGGIADPDAPLAVMKTAVAKWSEWLATL
jgi:hypothetical protein